MKDLPSSFLATPSASLRRSRLWASRSTLRVWKYSRLALVARSAFFLGRRKLRAKPSLTRTSSPIWPSFSTRSSRITCMSLHHIRQKRHEAGTLDRVRQLALVLVRDRGDARRHDLAALGDVALEQLHILVVDLGRVGAGEGIGLLPAEERPARRVAVAATSPPLTVPTTIAVAAAAFTISTIAHCAISSVMAVVSPSGLSVRSSRLRLLAETSNWSTLTVM